MALKLHEESLALLRDKPDVAQEAKILHNIGVVYEFLGQYQKALELHEQSLAIKTKLLDPAGEAQSLDGMGCVYGYLVKTRRRWIPREGLVILHGSTTGRGKSRY